MWRLYSYLYYTSYHSKDSRTKNKHGHWMCWMSMGTKSGLVRTTHTRGAVSGGLPGLRGAAGTRGANTPFAACCASRNTRRRPNICPACNHWYRDYLHLAMGFEMGFVLAALCFAGGWLIRTLTWRTLATLTHQSKAALLLESKRLSGYPVYARYLVRTYVQYLGVKTKTKNSAVRSRNSISSKHVFASSV